MLKIIYSDNHILVVLKPHGLCTQPDLSELAKAYVKEKYQKKGEVFLHPIHRLDKDVSGIVIFARTSKALTRLNEQQRERKIKKNYVAEVEGVLEESEGVLHHYLRHGSFKAEVVNKSAERAKSAQLSFKVLQRKEKSTILNIDLLTGRYHQIRAQFSAIGHPVLGDQKYGSLFKSEKLHLHHERVEFFHPVKKEKMIFESPPIINKS